MANSARLRLTLLFAGIVFLFLVSLGAVVHVSADRRMRRDFDRHLLRDAAFFGALFVEERDEFERGVHGLEWIEDLRREAELIGAQAAVRDPGGEVVFRTPDAPAASSAGLRSVDGRRIATVDLSRQGWTMHFSRSLDSLETYLGRQLVGLLVAVPVLTLAAAAAGWAFSGRVLRPVHDLTEQAREITAGDLSRRVPVPPEEGEFRRLALTINAMLARLEDSFARMREFTADAAHELRTPMSTMRSALESSLGRSPRELEEAAADALEELGRLSEITDKLLVLARADRTRLVAASAPADLLGLARQVVEAMQVAAGERRMEIRLEGSPAMLDGDASLLRRMLHNLVDNAVKYGREGGKVVVRVGPGGFEVEDDGPGIGPEHLPRIFDRFYRADAGRSSEIPGSGLGLAIVKSIAEVHGGKVEVESRPGRTLVRVRLPGRAPVATPWGAKDGPPSEARKPAGA